MPSKSADVLASEEGSMASAAAGVIKVTAAPRRPSQQRSRLRFEMLLDAADALLAEHEPTEVGLYDIAAAADVPPASVYHLFPPRRRRWSRWPSAISRG